MRSHVSADLGGIRASALNEFAGPVLHARCGAFGLGVAKKQKSAHGHAMDIGGSGHQFIMHSPPVERRGTNN